MLQERIDNFIVAGKIIDKVNRNKDSYWLNEELLCSASGITVILLYKFSLSTPVISKTNSPEHYSSIEFVLSKTPTTEFSKDQNIKDTEILTERM